MKKIRLLLALGLLFVTPLVIALSSPAVSFADTPQDEICSGVGLTTADGKCVSGGIQINGIISTVINFLSLAIGVIAVIMIIVAGLRFITSGGDAGKVKGAKDTIIYALIGLVIVVLAQTIVRFVLANVRG